MLNKFERAINNSESRDTGNIGIQTKKTKTNETTSSILKTYREGTQTPPNIG